MLRWYPTDCGAQGATKADQENLTCARTFWKMHTCYQSRIEQERRACRDLPSQSAINIHATFRDSFLSPTTFTISYYLRQSHPFCPLSPSSPKMSSESEPAVNLVAVPITYPVLDPGNPYTWFRQLENSFQLRDITKQKIVFQHAFLLSKLMSPRKS
ncbi:hypothetical protein ACTXT7_002195 [Hymenolepis weldensis]